MISRRKKMHKGRLQFTKTFSFFDRLRSYSFDLILFSKNVGQYPTAVSTGRSKGQDDSYGVAIEASPLCIQILCHCMYKTGGLDYSVATILFVLIFPSPQIAMGYLDGTYSYYARNSCVKYSQIIH